MRTEGKAPFCLACDIKPFQYRSLTVRPGGPLPESNAVRRTQSVRGLDKDTGRAG